MEAWKLRRLTRTLSWLAAGRRWRGVETLVNLEEIGREWGSQLLRGGSFIHPPASLAVDSAMMNFQVSQRRHWGQLKACPHCDVRSACVHHT
ncbi:hypothetical protein ElyMa_005069400 [Elysia marginata]|uniref:Uncharacterized protein n=1 Tax=Elysia marginata TaxID=1093978 RepID=A0AAV4JDM1_9GAST|nr:hypothetical protein ElyMa_005069400 [Elysia marginata]